MSPPADRGRPDGITDRPRDHTDGAATVAAAAERALALQLPADLTRPSKRSFTIRGHRTSVSLEPPFWTALVALAAAEDVPLARLVAAIDAARGDAGLSSAIRVYLLEACRAGQLPHDADTR